MQIELGVVFMDQSEKQPLLCRIFVAKRYARLSKQNYQLNNINTLH